ncbi:MULTISPECIES: hypothetical protein [Idiomarinaceae]|uniref:Chlorhexidine efflux transporter domain-containing protein n=1 Tax=Pseudidiomarina fusca TaxID=2965078 RepID=A0ABU3L056_9GAMM|nr:MULTISPECIES: hypothetical protein [Idiomarinaceae]MDT7526647.1 hypothetical protein [Pseudidiomarina sp. GXY010]MRJ41855.1 hypothetical protein [Idiomarina sp. FeN1]NCU57844.1 hypothetical protein [Idiomarina sp. FenA--70]NCU60396.1 hypothetical protein [Idiomarina sp. FenBw--71]UUN13948.1 hypothetical protein KGF88_01560 [Idiomarina loihiensis]
MISLQRGQAMVESLLLAMALLLILIVPVTEQGQTLLDFLGHIVASTAALFEWIWDDFLLQPGVS